MSKPKTKVLLVTFFDHKDIVHYEFLPQEQTINQHVYLAILRRLPESKRKKRPEKWISGEWMLHHDNAPAHRALSVGDYLTKNSMLTMPHPPYSPDIAPNDFFLFPRMKSVIKGYIFDTGNAIKKKSMSVLRGITSDKYSRCFRNWEKIMKHCIDSLGHILRNISHLFLPPANEWINRTFEQKINQHFTHRVNVSHRQHPCRNRDYGDYDEYVNDLLRKVQNCRELGIQNTKKITSKDELDIDPHVVYISRMKPYFQIIQKGYEDVVEPEEGESVENQVMDIVIDNGTNTTYVKSPNVKDGHANLAAAAGFCLSTTTPSADGGRILNWAEAKENQVTTNEPALFTKIERKRRRTSASQRAPTAQSGTAAPAQRSTYATREGFSARRHPFSQEIKATRKNIAKARAQPPL
ncbi:hypothetical protein LAZ67_20001364 [Cordylochernes scorpioides]|uniref:Transposase n=1 Tax=Cordylochernes scorpioides TaxID=51811 RepID=A0ABY6LMT0_9ARAC|nr:hypothetical protein LAZ67_20001364 [Cordylochernes scorpioides]